MISRRNFIRQSGLVAASSVFPIPEFLKSGPSRKLGVALVGLGYYSRDLLAPALQLTKYCELRGIVTGTPSKIPVWQAKYGIADRNVYNYENMYQMVNNDDIDIVYIVLPNAMHKKYTIIGAEAGKHVWCEKPMATTAKDCKAMIDSCRKNKVQLTIGYRMQHEPVTQEIIRMAGSRPFGRIEKLKAEAGFYNRGGDGSHWKLHPELGGGAMFDMGVYPLNAVRYATQMEPISVSARIENSRPELFKVDETTFFELEFPNGVMAKCKTSFAENINHLKIDCSSGWYELRPFQSYSGVQGRTSSGSTFLPFSGNQQAKQMDDDAIAIIENQDPVVPGEEGLRDIQIVESIFKSAQSGGARILLS
ncbi:Gfo/Idh/MocA family oxidoreductase [Lutimonas saemankumensis]|uniref:Gfo/Idh/MocA family protein n=1 Tax=Lutimonas saemankumensis TaxID=483016 RepID=UPI001CD3C48F|nr:Gfo/Idh/MocA family oxidoreductase [Lutimonas saemankumensis]MCA0932192.1 Gfo/Idh/MocA family oxidoreductase [Lutimonas saemankumensis]